MKGCTPRVARADKAITTAQLEVASGEVTRLIPDAPPDVRA